MKTIITLFNTSNKGKSETVFELAKLILNKIPEKNKIFSSYDIQKFEKFVKDFRLIVKFERLVIALESQGDPNTNNESRLEEILKDYEPEILVTTSRTRGKTTKLIDKLAKKFDYYTIWTSTYQATKNHDHFNKLKAKHLMQLIENTIKLK